MDRVPKNIRQIGGREERVKIYMEDYVSTYLRKLQEEREENGAVGMLTGQWQTEEGDNCGFLSGAMEITQADMERGQLQMTEEAWKEAYGILGTYFSGQELCGIFVCEGICRRFRRQALFAAVREHLPDQQEALLYILTEEGEEILYRITHKAEERLQGYYCYFERNEPMQQYMMEHLRPRRVEEEAVIRHRQKEGDLGDSVESFRDHMRRQQEEKQERKSGRNIFRLCAVMAAAVFVCGLLLMQKEQGGIQTEDLLARLKIDASQLLQASALPVGTEEEMAGTGEHYVSGSVVVEEIPGNVYPTEEETSGEMEEENSEENAEEHADDGSEESNRENVGANAEENAGDGADSEKGETAVEGSETMNAGETAAGSENESTVSEETESGSSEAPASTGVIYVVQAGDSLYSISRKFYGTEAMVATIQEMNQLSNADLIKEGQELILP